jgi:hypothetical protein
MGAIKPPILRKNMAKLNKKAMRNFWTQESKEPAHKNIKNALLAAGETPNKTRKKIKLAKKVVKKKNCKK